LGNACAEAGFHPTLVMSQLLQWEGKKKKRRFFPVREAYQRFATPPISRSGSSVSLSRTIST